MSRAVKLKGPSVVRTYDQDGFRKRAACICVNDDETKVLLVTSRKDVNRWIVPGGGVEPEEAVATTAVREVREEAGVCGNLGRCLGVFENAERRHRTNVYVLVVTEELDEWDESHTYGRLRQWFTVEAAVAALHKPLQSSYVKLLLPPDHLYHTQPPHISAALNCQPTCDIVTPHTADGTDSNGQLRDNKGSETSSDSAEEGTVLVADSIDSGTLNTTTTVNSVSSNCDDPSTFLITDGVGEEVMVEEGVVTIVDGPVADAEGSAAVVLDQLCGSHPPSLSSQDCKDQLNIVGSSLTASISTG